MMAATAALACGPREGSSEQVGPTAPPTTPPAEPAAPAPPPEVEARYACERDEDCLVSCAQGAVSWRWYREALPGGESCEDGCAADGISARCEAGACVATRDDGAGPRPDPSCTRRDDAPPPERPGPAHRCAADDDCTLRCRLGAVNRRTIGALVELGPDCRDGCRSAGMSVRCEEGRCLALRLNEPEPLCTERSIWPERR